MFEGQGHHDRGASLGKSMTEGPNSAPPPPAAPPLDAAESARLIDFARACKAAARAVVLYPAGHPAIVATLGRIVQLTSVENLPAPLRITVSGQSLQVGGRSPARHDASLAELAVLLHDHSIGELTVNAGGDVDAWRNFLLLLGRSATEVRAEGGISRLWSTTAGNHVEVREIDYAEVLREKRTGDPAMWEDILANCLQGDTTLDLDEEEARMLLEIANDETQLGDLLVELEARAAEDQTPGARVRAVVRLLREIVKAAKKNTPDGVDGVLRNMAGAVGRLSPEMMVELLSHTDDATGDASGVVDAVVTRMTEKTIAGFVARNASTADSSLDRVAQAFHTLVRDEEQKQRLLALAHDEAAASPFGSTDGFEEVWNHVAEKLLTSYSDKDYVSDSYARELSGSRTQAITIDQIKDDPPERIRAWLGSVATSELRHLDLTLLLDLLKIEQDDTRWGTLMPPVVALVEDLLLVGDFEALTRLIGAVTDAAKGDVAPGRQQHALVAIDTLATGSMMRQLATHLTTIEDAQFERVKAMCTAMGEVVVRPIAEAISTDISERARDRLTAVLVAFGAAGRRQVERLKASDNPAVRRTALYLLRELGGQDALPELTELLNDRSPQIQREAVRAILSIGTDAAFGVLQQALTTGSESSRVSIMKSLASARDERAAPMLAYILGHLDYKGPHLPIYLSAVEALGALKDPQGVAALRDALYRGEWWAPRRTATLRSAVAIALGRVGTKEAAEVIEEAHASGPRGVRNAVRPHLAKLRAKRDAEVKA
jgi:HEAT repeat protein